jgi:hypothetical protein
MGTKGRGFLLAAGILGSILAGAAPALAQSHGGGGHGGGHASGGGHSSGGGHAASAGGHFGGGGGPHYAAGGHFGGGYGGASYARGYGGVGYAHSSAPIFHGSTYAGHGYAGRGVYGHSGGYYGRGYGYSTGTYWAGGYWRGGFWPRCYYGVGFSWFLPILPLAYATYWYAGIPYYYANDVYYTYNPDYEGYVATDPPPVAESGAAADGAAPAVGTAPGGAAAGQIFMYPKNGQSAEQQATDKAECQQWAAEQAGQVAQNGSDYPRAMAACVEGRGYSAR